MAKKFLVAKNLSSFFKSTPVLSHAQNTSSVDIDAKSNVINLVKTLDILADNIEVLAKNELRSSLIVAIMQICPVDLEGSIISAKNNAYKLFNVVIGVQAHVVSVHMMII